MQAIHVENLRVILDPAGAAAAHTANYAPVFLLALMLEYRLFGSDVLGYHVVNVIAHAGVSLLLVRLFRRSGLPLAAALGGGLVFLLHPANAEVVAWITQLKTILCLLFALAALLLHPRRPLLASLCFALGLLSKTSALFALPVAAYEAWRGRGQAGERAPRSGWLLLWLLLFLLYAGPQMAAFGQHGESPRPMTTDLLDHARTIFAIGARYLVMASSSIGLSTFHNPPLTTAWSDPWWWAGLAAGAAIAVRAVTATRRASPEAGYWLWAAVAYAPISQVFPFMFPMADRYLYVVLPGLIGAVCCIATHMPSPTLRRWNVFGRDAPSRIALALACAGILALALRSHERSLVFETSQRVNLDSARHYPDGIVANLLRAKRLGREGNLGDALAALERATAQGFDDFHAIDTEPAFAPYKGDPRFRAFVADLAGAWLTQARARGYVAQYELRGMAQAHLARGERDAALRVLEEALARGGPANDEIERQIGELRRSSGGR